MVNIFTRITSTYGHNALQLVRRHERCLRRLARFNNHLTFLMRSIKSSVIPKDLRIKSPVHTQGARRAAETASIRFLRERILLTRLTRDSTEKEVSITASDIHVLLSPADSNEIRLHDAIFRDVFQKSKERQQAKFLDLLVPTTQTRHERAVDTEKWVVNLSSRTLSPTENSLLKKGMSFAIAPKRIPAVEIVSRVESTIRTLDAESKESIRKDISTVLQQAKPPKPNITGEMHRALEALKKDRDIIVLPADKG
ncbi:uncharacterized protein [Diadema setosum]|uniref:uncharacterized protein n=1 Tax=Diadema setosum TaxID=31175 RepID=UPI003B3BBA5B